MLRLMVVFIGVTGLSWLLVHSVRDLSAQLSGPPNFLEIDGCALPCWQGLQPGVDTPLSFWEMLDDVNAAGGWMYDGNPVMDGQSRTMHEFTLNIQPSPQLSLGDVLLAYGAPEFVYLQEEATLGGNVGARRLRTVVYLFWADSFVMVRAIHSPDVTSDLISPAMFIERIMMRENALGVSMRPAGARQWHGFAHYPP